MWQDDAKSEYTNAMEYLTAAYRELISMGVAREQARILLPLSLYTEFYWTASFQSIMNFIELRDHEHAQYEIQVYAQAISAIMKQEFPYAYEAWVSA